jgi:ligand-binding sensor domain-containing protein/serine phosphatase RsbU (regulator of sigma subunit)
MKSINPFIIFLLTILILQACKKSYKDDSTNTIEFIQEKKVKLIPIIPPKIPTIIEAGKPIIRNAGNPTPYIIQEGAGEHGGFSKMQNYTTDDGLAMDVVQCSFKDNIGNLWFGTLGAGISKFDGKTFTNYNTSHGLCSNQVFSICQDKQGNLWFATTVNGVSKFDGHQFTNYTTKDGLTSNNFYSVILDSIGNLWFGSKDNGISKYDGRKFINYTTTQGLINNNVQTLKLDSKGRIWIGTEGGISVWDGIKFTNYSTSNGLPDNLVKTIIEDKTGGIWIGTLEKGFSCFKNGVFINYYDDKETLGESIFCSILDKNGNIWFGTDGDGVLRYDGKKFTKFTTKQGLSNDAVFDITEDNTGNLWFSTYGGGVIRYDGAAVTNYTTNQGLPYNNFLSIQEDSKGNIWFGTIANGVVKFDEKSFTTYNTSHGLSGNTISSIFEDKNGNLWFGDDDKGVCYYDGKSFTNYTEAQGLISNHVLGCKGDSKGNIWISTMESGIVCFNGKTFTNYTEEHGLAKNMVLAIFEDSKGRMWFGSYGGGLSCFDGKTFTNYNKQNGLSGNNIFCIIEDKKGNIWVGVDEGGVSLISNIEKASATIRIISTKQGLTDNFITQILQLQDGRMMLGTNFGVNIFDCPDFSKKEKLKNIQVLNTENGYPIKDVNVGQNCMMQDKNGIVWLGTGSDKTALVRLDLSKLNIKTQKPKVYIQNIKINNTPIVWSDLMEKTNANDTLNTPANITEETSIFGKPLTLEQRAQIKNKFGDITFNGLGSIYYVPQNLVLPYKNNSITVDFLAIEPAKSNLIKYQYLLEGYDEDWSPVSNKTSATFGNIFEGTYTLKIRAKFTGLSTEEAANWSEPISYTFTVLPPWYRTWWAYLLYVGFTAFSIYIIFRWRTSILRKDKELLELTVKKRTSELQLEKKTVEFKNREILSSIEYAKKIQATILPSPRVVKKYLHESFILYLPKDIVAGDFYWMESPIGSDTVYFAACDCTGHGVPGAMVSVMCHNALNKSLIEFGKRKPSEILDKVAELVIENFKKNADDTTQIYDGMDASLCALDVETGELQWAGANNPLWIIKNGNSFLETRADKQPVGFAENRFPYKNHIFNLEKGDVIYLITDGFADQFGGENDRKFQKSRLKQLLIEINKMTMEQQRIKLYETFTTWKGNNEQVDDITIIGVRL